MQIGGARWTWPAPRAENTRENTYVNCKQSLVCVAAASWRVRFHGRTGRPAPEPGHRRRGVGWMNALRFAAFARQGRTHTPRVRACANFCNDFNGRRVTRRLRRASKPRRWQAECLTDRGPGRLSRSSGNGSLCRNEFAYAGWLKGREEEDQRGFAIRLSASPLGRLGSSAVCLDGEFGAVCSAN